MSEHCKSCGSVTFKEILTPHIQHYGKIECADCGKWVRWIPRPINLTKEQEQVAYEMKDLNGALFKNKKKEKDTDSGYQGSCKIDGNEYWINAWVKETKGTPPEKYFQLSFKKKS